jgi:SAM-dependent methyltransferase
MNAETSCRVCGATTTRDLGEVEYLAGFSWKVRDCASCGCRFTTHDASIHNRLHETGAISSYSAYRTLADEAGRLFAAKNVQGLRQFLTATGSKYRFIIEEAERHAPEASFLEAGCSRGYLTSYLLLTGRRVLGVDASAEAVAAACAQFGNHFALVDAPEMTARAPYDVIYHVGTIGCVGDPLGLTNRLLDLLKPGGSLLFNAPNVEACHLPRQLWLDSAPPPDLVTLFPPGFWKEQYRGRAEVIETVEMLPADQSFRIWLSKLAQRPWQKPVAQQLAAPTSEASAWHQSSGYAWTQFVRVATKLAKVTRLANLTPRLPHDFGIFVKMTKVQ